MSYTEHAYADVPYSGSVSYSGYGSCSCGKGVSISGSVPYSGSVPVSVDVHVDTSPFDSAVNQCNGTVHMLTASVAATEAAQIAAINANAKKVSNAIISGFFKTIGSEISQQTAQLENELNSTLMHLVKLTEKIQGQQKIMELDYNRISERFLKVFHDLDSELKQRVHAIDAPVFDFERLADESLARLFDTDMASTAAVFGRENGRLQTMIGVASTKENARRAIDMSKRFLFIRKTTDDLLLKSSFNENQEERFFLPACVRVTQDGHVSVSMTTENDTLNGRQAHREISAAWLDEKKYDYENIDEDDMDRIKMYFHAEANAMYGSSDPKSKRVLEMLQKITDFNAIRKPVVCKN